MINGIDEIFCMLSSNDDLILKKGIEQAKQIEHLSVFFQPIESKHLWERCAKIIIDKDNKTLKPYLYQMFEWLKDLNWPGADLIYNRLLSFDREIIEQYYKISLNSAHLSNDFVWERILLDFWKDYLEYQKK